MWRACYDAFLTRVNLVKRKVSDQVLCPICELEEKSLTHTLWEYLVASDVWRESSSPLRKWIAKAKNIREL